MKKIICLITALCLILGSFSFCFASPTQWDTSDQANLRYIYQTLTSGSLYTLVNNIYSRMNTINNSIQDLADFLVYNGNSITEWVYSIEIWMSPIFNAINSIPVDLDKIVNGLWKPLENGSSVAYLSLYEDALVNEDPGVTSGFTSAYWRTHLHQNLFTSANRGNGIVDNPVWNIDNGLIPNQIYASYGTPLGLLNTLTNRLNLNMVNGLVAHLTGATDQQSYTSWLDLSSSSFNPDSQTDGIYNWLSNIQTPVARLSYVLASDERIEAQEAAAANEEAVVDNFIDSTGDGSASPSDIGSISDLSSGYKSNFGSDASVSGIFNIFNSNNMGWFSQETANQLDTTTPTRRGSSFDTPLLDQQIRDIYDQIGVVND